MPPVRKILIADPDASIVRALAPALRQRGYQVHAARDGTRALQVAILRFPDVILLDDKTPLLDPRTFMRILRTNPRTERIPVVLMGDTADADKARLGVFVKKPFKADEVVARIEQIFRRVDASKAVAGESREIEGDLAQIPLVDLLQILAVNRKTGKLAVEHEGAKAEVYLKDGKITDAVMGAATGEKALWRLLGSREGQFAFLPGPGGAERIDRKVDELVLEGLRQADEVARLADQLPPPTDHIELTLDPSELPAGLHPVTEEVVALLATPRSFQELVDRTKSSDLEAIRAVLALLDRGYARRRRGPPPPADTGALLGAHEVHALRQRIARGRSSGNQTVGKVVLAGGGPLARRAALARFQTLAGFQAAPGGASGFGTLGRLALGEGVRVDVVEIPGDPSLRPLRGPFSAGAVGALVLLPAEDDGALLSDLSNGQRLPLVVCGPSEAAVPQYLRDAPGGFAFGGPDAAEALRMLLAGAAAKGSAEAA
ncbi:MAG: DUF4388 domain-containing protein [Anaeromyxobacter sp.]